MMTDPFYKILGRVINEEKTNQQTLDLLKSKSTVYDDKTYTEMIGVLKGNIKTCIWIREVIYDATKPSAIS